MPQIVTIGCGVVGAAIAYELSQIPNLKITTIDRQEPAQGATSAALGVLMGAISHKVKGRAWQLRRNSMERYETLIPELESITGRQIPFNRQGILKLCFAGENMTKWEELVKRRRQEKLHLEILSPDEVRSRYPYLGNLDLLIGAIYSPQDRQVEPVALTQALVDAARSKGVTFQFGIAVEGFKTATTDSGQNSVTQIQTEQGNIAVDFLVIAAGLGSTSLTAELKQTVDIRPILGQGLQLHLGHSLSDRNFQPVITGDDVHIVPCTKGQEPITDYLVGATVEEPRYANGELEKILPDAGKLDEVLSRAIAFCPDLAKATVVKKWFGLRPRPEGQPAPVIGPLEGYANVLLATGHYRNGILLAPATAIAIRDKLKVVACA